MCGDMDTIRADEIVEHTLQRANADLAARLESDVVMLSAPIIVGLDDSIRDEIENLVEDRMDGEVAPKKLSVLLETSGGYIEIVERIVAVFRRHYSFVDFIIPNYAYSAGTVLALSGDDIYMDYYSVLGPIDPQFRTENGDSVPGLGYIAKYNELVEIINSADDGDAAAVKAELAFLLRKFDPAKLFHIEQAIQHSRDLVEEWLPKYKFKDWEITESTGKRVTMSFKKERAKSIADRLADAEHWHSHGRGISKDELENDGIGLKINDFGSKSDLNHNIRHYHGLFSDYIRKLGIAGAVHTRNRLRRVA